MDTHTDPTPTTSPTITSVETYLAERAARIANAPRIPEWRRRSLEAAGASPFVAVADMTDRVAGR